MRICLLAFFMLATSHHALLAEGPSGSSAPIVHDSHKGEAKRKFPPAGSKVLFLGDSITNAGQYISIMDSWFRTRQPGRRPALINLGLPSETACGLSEPDHPFPRPDVHERLERALEKVDPDIVVACYGMNDGIYYPFSTERFNQYVEGMNRLIQKVQASGAKLVLMTPPPFDPEPFRKLGKLKSKDAEKFAWFAIYENYDDEVIRRYADWVKNQSERVEMVVDLWTPMFDFVGQQRKVNGGFQLSPDGVHLNEQGHYRLAKILLESWGHSMTEPVDELLFSLVHQQQMVLHNAWLTHVGHERPGMKPGLPLPQAKQAASELEEKIAKLLAGQPVGVSE